MTSFRLPISAKSRTAGRFIASVHRELQQALVRTKVATGITQQALADKLGVNRSVINRRFLGKENLTLRTIGEIAWALDLEPVFELRQRTVPKGSNHPPAPSTIEEPDEIVFKRALARPVATSSSIGEKVG